MTLENININDAPVGSAAETSVNAITDVVAIRVQNLSKCYQIYDKPHDRLKQFVIPKLCRAIPALSKFFPTIHSPLPTPQGIPTFHKEFWALKNVSFEIKKGETVGIIGRNGSGKSTLLQLICGTVNPTSGSIKTNGRIAALLELGSGFNPEFTGRENVYLNGTVLGLRKEEIDARFKDIAKFADIGEFIDQPVKAYSSGMMVRLAFSVIVHVDADILVIDEALSVGDMFFSQKCMRFLADFKSKSGTILFVSHDVAAITNLCSRSLMLSLGSLVTQGLPVNVCNEYMQNIYMERDVGVVKNVSASLKENYQEASEIGRDYIVCEQKKNPISVSPFNYDSASIGLKGAVIIDAGFFDENGDRLNQIFGDEEVKLTIIISSKKTIYFPAIGLVIKDRLGQAVFTESTTIAFESYYSVNELVFNSGDTVKVDFIYKMPILIAGEYAVTIAVAEGYGHDHVQHHLMHEGLMLKSIDSRLLHGIAGFNDLKLSIKIRKGISEL